MANGGLFGFNTGGAPPQPRRAMGMGESLVRGVMAGKRGMRQADARGAAMAEAEQRFRSIGSEEANRAADLIRENPRGFVMSAESLGGPAQMEQQFKTNALQSRATSFMADRGAGGMDPQAIFDDAIAKGFPVDVAQGLAKGAMDLQPKAVKPTYLKGADGYYYDATTKERVFPDVVAKETKGGGGGPTPAQQAKSRKVLDARERLQAWMQENEKTPDDMRRIISRGSDPWAVLADDSEDRWAAQLWSTARDEIVGGDPGRGEFMDAISGAVNAEGFVKPPKAPEPMPSDHSRLVDGDTYLMENPETGETVAATYNAETQAMDY